MIKKRFWKYLIVGVLFICTSCSKGGTDTKTDDKVDKIYSDTQKTSFDDMVFDVSDSKIISENEYLRSAFSEDDVLFCVKSSVYPAVVISEYDNEMGKTEEVTFLQDEFEYGLKTNNKLYGNEKYWFIVNNTHYNDSNGVYLIDRTQKSIIGYINTEDREIIDISVSETDRVYMLCSRSDFTSKKNTIEIYESTDCKEIIDIEEILKKGKNYDIRSLCTDDENNIFIVYDTVTEKRIARIDADKNLIYDAEIENIWGINIKAFVCADGSVLVSGGDNSSVLINRIDAATGQTTDYYQCGQGGCFSAGLIDDTHLFLYDERNIYTFSLAENSIVGDPVPVGQDEVLTVNEGKVISLNKINLHEEQLVKYSLNSLDEKESINFGESEIIMVDNNSEDKICFIERFEDDYYINLADTKGNILGKEKVETGIKRFVDICYDCTGKIYILLDDEAESAATIIEFDESLRRLSDTQIEDVKCSMGLDSYLGQVYIEYYSLNENRDVYKNKDEKEDIPFSIGDSIIEKIYPQSSGEALVKTDDQKIMKYKGEGDQLVPLFDISTLPFTIDQIDDIIYINDNYQLLHSGNDLYKVTSDSIEGKKVLKIATDTFFTLVDRYISQFRENNPDTLIKIIDYSEMDSEDINIDLASGNVPDIIISDGDLDLSIFECKDLFLDLSEYIEDDKYFDNIFAAVSGNTGKITQITPYFNILTTVGKQSEIGKSSGWTLDEYLDQKNDIFFYRSDRTVWTPEMLAMVQFSEFIDTDSGKMTVPELFGEYLEILRDEINIKNDEMYYSEEEIDKGEKEDLYERRFLDGKCNLDVVDITDISDIYRLRYGYINEPIVFKGLPSDNSNGSFVSPQIRISVLNTCNTADEAWKFIDMFLSDEEQNEIAEHGIGMPVLKSAFENMFERYTEDSVFIRAYCGRKHIRWQCSRPRSRQIDW